jgi:hypothetical protein
MVHLNKDNELDVVDNEWCRRGFYRGYAALFCKECDYVWVYGYFEPKKQMDKKPRCCPKCERKRLQLSQNDDSGLNTEFDFLPPVIFDQLKSEFPIVDDSPQPLGDECFSIDWFSITIFSDRDPHASQSAPTVVDERVLSLLNITQLDYSGYGGNNYRFMYRGSFGSRFFTNPVNAFEDNNYHSHLDLSGSACDFIDNVWFYELFDYLHSNDIRYNITRLDIAYDTTAFDPEHLIACAHDANLKTRVHRRHMTYYQDIAGEGCTFYIGSPKSDARMRIYRKLDDPENPIFLGDYTRVELQVRDEHARYTWLSLLSTTQDQWATRGIEIMNGFVEFYHDAWASLRDTANKAWVKIQHKKPSFERVHKWLMQQVAPTLSAWFDAWKSVDYEKLGEQRRKDLNGWLEFASLLEFGRSKRKPNHREIITTYNSHMLTVLGTSHFDVLNDFQDRFIKRKTELYGDMGKRMAYQQIRMQGIQNLFDSFNGVVT